MEHPQAVSSGGVADVEEKAAAATSPAPASHVTIFRRSLDMAPLPATSTVHAADPTRQLTDSPLAVTDMSEGPALEEIELAQPKTTLAPIIAAAAEDKGADGQSVRIDVLVDNSGRPAQPSTAVEAEPLLKPHPNLRNPNVDLSRGPSVPYPSPNAEPHVVSSTLPWLQRYVDRRWRFLFPAYRRLDVWGLRGFSVCELIFIAVYSIVNLALIVSGIAQLATASKYDGDDGDIYNIAKRFGIYGAINVLLLLLPNTRNNVWQYVFGMSFERSVWYHKWIARVAVAELAIHGAANYAERYYNDSLWDSATGDGVTGEYGSGTIAFFIAVAIVVLSLYPFRRYLHECFLRLHIVLFVAFIVFAFIHDGKVNISAMVPALALYAADWALRISMWRQPVRVLNVQLLPGGVTRITFQKDRFTYQAGQYIFICLPAVSPWEWHPFSLSSSPHHPVLTVHCKSIGRWTRRLAELARQGADEKRDWSKLKMHTEGPYGQLSVPLAHYSSVLLVCGGIGVTPLGSVYNSLVHDHYRGVRRLRQLKLVWSLREPALISSLYDDVRRAETVDKEERVEAAGEPPSYYFHPRALAQRDALADAANDAPPTGSSVRLPIQPLAGRIKNAFHLTKLSSTDEQQAQLRGVQSYYGEWIKEGRPELAVAFAEMKAAMTEERVAIAVPDGAATAGANVGGEQVAGGVVQRCAVLACGPRLLIDDVRAFCIRQSSAAVKFDLHEEEFLW